MSRSNKARARRTAARLNSPPSKRVEQPSTADPKSVDRRAVVPFAKQRRGIPRVLSALTRSLRVEQLEPRRVLAPILVTTPLDVVDFNDGQTSLREAIFAANTVPGPDEIAFDFGHDGPATILLTHGELAISDSLTITGPGADLLTIDASGNDPTPNLKNGDGSRAFTVVGGRAADFRLIVADVRIVGGDTIGQGGAIYSRHGLKLIDVVIEQNYGAAGGGAIAVPRGELVVEGSSIIGNRSRSGAAGILGPDFEPSTIAYSLVAENTSERGGAGLAFTPSAAVGNAGFVTIIGSTFRGNEGAGVDISSPNGFLISSSALVDNVSRGAGAGLVVISRAGTIENSTISGNRSASSSAAIRMSNLQSLVIRSSTITNNITDSDQTGDGTAALVAGPNVHFEHSVIAGNRRGDGTPGDLLAVGATANRSLIGYVRYRTGQSLPEAPLGNPDTNGNLIGGPIHGAIDPLLAPLANNGGPTLTHALLPGSPAIDAGDAALRPGIGDTPQFDQRGEPFSRVAAARIDIGAVEQSGVPFFVDTLVDESDNDYRRGDLSLREAIELANAQSGSDVITFDPALFAAGPATILLTHGELAITDSLNLTGPGADLLTIDASGNDPTPDLNNGDGSRVFSLPSLPAGSTGHTISGMTLTGGDVSGDGGAILARPDLDLNGVDLSSNAAARGGGVAGDRLRVVDSRVVQNFARGGGGIFSSGNLLAVESSSIGENQADGGAGILASPNSQVTVTDSTISFNVSTIRAGGILVLSSVAPRGASLRIATSTIDGNRGEVGGIDASAARFEMIDSAVTNNISTTFGGGLFVSRGLIANSTISGNTAATHGGGIFAISSPIDVRHSTITGNTADSDNDGTGSGGGFWGSSARLNHSIVAANSQGNGTSDDLLAVSATARHNLIGYASTRTGQGLPEAPLGAPDADGNLIGGPIHGAIDPLLAPLADNGGPTLTHALLPGSPAIDAGDAALRPGIGDTPQFDQRGEPFSRVAAARIDIGAVEQSGVPFFVDTLVDESDNDYRRGDLSLREAIELANAQSGSDVITFDPALFAAGPATILLTHGELAITDALTITGPGTDLLTVDASGNDPTPDVNNGDGSRVFFLPSLPAGSTGHTISRMTLTGGDVSGDGGAIHSLEDLTIQDCIVRENAAFHGGGVSGGRVTMLRSQLLRNSALGSGGGVYSPDGRLTIADCTLAENSAAAGGGVSAFFSALIVTASRFSRNTSRSVGGAVAALGDDASIVDSTITENSAANGGGLELLVEDLAMVNSTIAGNHALVSGGGMRILSTPDSASAQRLIIGCTISDNTTHLDGAFGGGIYGAVGGLIIETSTISGNDSAGVGGGAYFELALNVRFHNCTFVYNSASSEGGGIYLRNGQIDAANSILARNTAANEGHDFVLRNDAILDLRYSLIGSNEATSLIEAPIGAPDAKGNLIGGPIHGTIDPLLAPLANNGGPTLTHALLPGSPAIGAGDPTLTPGQGGAPEFDQRGAPFTRVAGGRVDIGAFELQPVSGALQADFDLDGDADGNDFLTWQRNLGKTAGATLRHGDATADGDVDRDDLAVWRARFSSPGSTTSGATSTARAAYAPPARTLSILEPRPSTLPLAQPATALPRRNALATQLRERLAPPPRAEFALPASTALDFAFAVANQSRCVPAATRQQAADDSEADDFAAALDAAFSER